jgi:hypothetical protein
MFRGPHKTQKYTVQAKCGIFLMLNQVSYKVTTGIQHVKLHITGNEM